MHNFIYSFCLLFVLNTTFAQSKSSLVVEVAAFAESAPNGYFSEIAGIYETLDVNYIYRYYVNVPDQAAAENKKKEVRDAGFINARIIDFAQLKKECNIRCQYDAPKKTGKDINPFVPLNSNKNGGFSDNGNSNARNTTASSNANENIGFSDNGNSNANENGGFSDNGNSNARNAKTRRNSKTSSNSNLNQNIPFIYPSSGSATSPENFHCIFFDFDESYIRDDAKIELDRLITLMQNNPTHQVEILAHTDARGTQKYNNALSLRRAISTQDYLTKHGIKRTKIIKKSLGESSPIALNQLATGEDTIVGRQLNRRVEFIILDKSGKVLNVVDKIKVPEQIQK